MALFESGGLATPAARGHPPGAHPGGAGGRRATTGRSGSVAPSGSVSVAPPAPGSAGFTGSGTLLHGATPPLYLTKDASTGAYLLRDAAHMADTRQHNVIQTWDASSVSYQDASGVWPDG